MSFVDGGYQYVFMKPYTKHQHSNVKKETGELTLQIYDNGVQIRTLVTKNEINTLINRDVAVDKKNRKVYILEADQKAIENPDGTISVVTT